MRHSVACFWQSPPGEAAEADHSTSNPEDSTRRSLPASGYTCFLKFAKEFRKVNAALSRAAFGYQRSSISTFNLSSRGNAVSQATEMKANWNKRKVMKNAGKKPFPMSSSRFLLMFAGGLMLGLLGVCV